MVSLIISDVDGVLTDGRINIGEKGEAFKSFDVKDGLGIVRWIESGGEFALVTARESDAVSHRATELNIDRVYQNVSDKVRQIEQIASDVGVSLDDIAYIGDDTSDVPAIEAAGVGGAPADASPSARRAADHVCANDGGHGAIREFVDYLDDDSDEVRAAAAWALRQIGTEAALEAAAAHVDDRSFLVQHEAELAADALDDTDAEAPTA